MPGDERTRGADPVIDRFDGNHQTSRTSCVFRGDFVDAM
jgi:hypothetical protein